MKKSKSFAFVFFAALLAGNAAAEVKVFGGFSAGVFSETVKTADGKGFESKLPLAVFAEADYFPRPDCWLGFSGKVGFSGNFMTSCGKRGESGWHKDIDAQGNSSSISLFVAPSAVFRKTFKNLQYVSASAGPAYNFSYLDMPMKCKRDGKTVRRDMRNVKNSVGLNFEGFYKLSKTAVDHGIFVNVQWLFASKDSDFFGARFRAVNAIDFSIGYKVGGTFLQKGESLTAVYKSREERRLREIQALQAEENARLEAEKNAEAARKKAESERKKALLKISRKSESPVLIAAKSCENRADGGKNLVIEFQNVSDEPLSKVVFKVVAKDGRGRRVKGDSASRQVAFDRPVEPNFSAYAVAKRNFWQNPQVADFDIISMTVCYADGKKKTVRDIDGATIPVKFATQGQEIVKR